MISLTSRGSGPLDSQVADSLRRLLCAGAFQPGEDLPTPQALAWDLAVNLTAVRRAYDTLAQEGLVEVSNGTYQVVQRRPDARREELLNSWDASTAALLKSGFPRKELEKRLREVKIP